MGAEIPRAPVGFAETHISIVFFGPDRAYKLLKPVTTAFLDYAETPARLEAVDRELRLNARLAPDVYLGTADVVEHGEVVDRMLVMERMPDDRRLTALVDTPGFDDALRAVARAVAAFHAGLPPVREPVRMATTEGMASLWESSFSDLEPVVGPVLEPSEFERARALVRRYLAHQGPMFEHRREVGAIRDGHGDLTAQDIFLLDDGPQILDCLAFDDQMRVSDVLADIGFLVMDVHRLAGVDAAHRLMGWYSEFTDAHHPSSLAHHYVAYRAHVRAKIEVLRYQQGVAEAAPDAREYHALAWHHLERAKLRLVMIGGGPGSGKTTLAHSIAQRTGWSVLDSDELRKDLAGIGHRERTQAGPDEGIYQPEMTDRTYATLVARAGTLLEAGESVILDASWTDGRHREDAREMAARHGAELVELECRLDADEARNRIVARQRRGDSASDAGPEIIEHLSVRHDPWPQATQIDTSRGLASVTEQALDAALTIPVE